MIAASKTTQSRAPAHLSDRAKRFWRAVQGEYVIDPTSVDLLQSAAEQLTRSDQAREVIDRDSPTVKDRFGQIKPHPMIAEERQSHLAFIRICRELGLSVETDNSRPPSRPPGYIPSQR